MPQSAPSGIGVFKGTDGNTQPAQLNAQNAVNVAIVSGGGSGGTASDFGTTFPATGTAAGFIDPSGNMAGVKVNSSGEMLVAMAGGGSAVSIANGADVAEGAIADAAVTGDNDGTVNAHLRGLDKILADVWDSGNNRLKVGVQNATIAVTQSGTWTVQPGNTANTTPWLVTGSGTAGSAATGVLTVQGIASMTPLLVNGSGSTQPVSGTVTVTQGTAANLNATVVQGTATNLKAQAECYQGGIAVSSSAPLQVTLANTGSNTNKLLVTPDANSAINLAQVGGTNTVTGGVNGTLGIGGTVAHDAPATGNPVPAGGVAKTSLPTAVAADDRTAVMTDVYGRPFVRTGYESPCGNIWVASHFPSANTQATIDRAAAGSGVRNVCTALTVTLAAGTSAPSAIQLTAKLIDDSGGTPVTLWGTVISLPATAGAVSAFTLTKLWLPSTANKALTLQFSATGGANTIQSVWMTGTTVAE